MNDRQQFEAAIAVLEAQRKVVGDSFADAGNLVLRDGAPSLLDGGRKMRLSRDRGGRTNASDELFDAYGDLHHVVFYGCGFGLWNRVGPAAGMALAVGIFFGSQVRMSVYWLRRHEEGPVERPWSRLTYGRPQKLAKLQRGVT